VAPLRSSGVSGVTDTVRGADAEAEPGAASSAYDESYGVPGPSAKLVTRDVQQVRVDLAGPSCLPERSRR
jgi:hypothetical protein